MAGGLKGGIEEGERGEGGRKIADSNANNNNKKIYPRIIS